jgi:hypothetical protein
MHCFDFDAGAITQSAEPLQLAGSSISYNQKKAAYVVYCNSMIDVSVEFTCNIHVLFADKAQMDKY